MNEVFEKIIEKLKYAKEHDEPKVNNKTTPRDMAVYNITMDFAMELVKRVMNEYGDGWIPAEEPPETDGYILLSFENFSVPCIGRYEDDAEGGAYFIGDDDTSCISEGMIVNGWQPCPKSRCINSEGSV